MMQAKRHLTISSDLSTNWSESFRELYSVLSQDTYVVEFNFLDSRDMLSMLRKQPCPSSLHLGTMLMLLHVLMLGVVWSFQSPFGHHPTISYDQSSSSMHPFPEEQQAPIFQNDAQLHQESSIDSQFDPYNNYAESSSSYDEYHHYNHHNHNNNNNQHDEILKENLRLIQENLRLVNENINLISSSATGGAASDYITANNSMNNNKSSSSFKIMDDFPLIMVEDRPDSPEKQVDTFFLEQKKQAEQAKIDAAVQRALAARRQEQQHYYDKTISAPPKRVSMSALRDVLTNKHINNHQQQYQSEHAIGMSSGTTTTRHPNTAFPSPLPKTNAQAMFPQ